LTIAEEDEIYWERWQPESGFIVPITWKRKQINLIDDKKVAVKLSAFSPFFKRLLIGFPEKIFAMLLPSFIAKKGKAVESLKNSERLVSATENIGNFTTIDGKVSSIQYTIYEKRMLQRPSVPETLRDLAYRHENEVEEEINEKEPSTLIPFIAPLGESGSS
ncbi:unnamed protein product, partial [Wuchereria bancrofti]